MLGRRHGERPTADPGIVLRGNARLPLPTARQRRPGPVSAACDCPSSGPELRELASTRACSADRACSDEPRLAAHATDRGSASPPSLATGPQRTFAASGAAPDHDPTPSLGQLRPRRGRARCRRRCAARRRRLPRGAGEWPCRAGMPDPTQSADVAAQGSRSSSDSSASEVADRAQGHLSTAAGNPAASRRRTDRGGACLRRTRGGPARVRLGEDPCPVSGQRVEATHRLGGCSR